MITERTHARLGQRMFRSTTTSDSVAKHQRQRKRTTVGTAAFLSFILLLTLASGNHIHEQTELIGAADIDKDLLETGHDTMETGSGDDAYILWQGNIHSVGVGGSVIFFLVRVLFPVYLLGSKRQFWFIQQSSHGGSHGGRRQNHLWRSLGQIQPALLVFINLHHFPLVQHGMQQLSKIILEALFQHGIHLINHHMPNTSQVNISCIAMFHQSTGSCHQNIHGAISHSLPLFSISIPTHQQLTRNLTNVSDRLEHPQYLTCQFSRGCQDERARTTRTAETRQSLHGEGLVLDVHGHEFLGTEGLDYGEEVG
mmetsp:Transcript_20612/g.37244  ORF Transcript_20612/g.37244 Transcript_20612/m.37244 type:complete len:311 (-) Transcript_20612:982-1914(-)